MAGGYKAPKTGTEGLAERVANLQRQIDQIRAASPMTSAQIKNGLFVVTDENGQPIAMFGVIPVVTTDDDSGVVTEDHLLGSQYRNPDGSLIMTAAYSQVLGLTAFQVGDIDDLSNVALVRIYSDDVAINCNDFDLNNSGDTMLNSGGLIGLGAAGGTYIQHDTTGSAANARIESSGLISRSTSSLRYKQDVEDATVDVEAFLNLRPRTWRDRGAVAKDPKTAERHIGFVAEEVDELGLPFVEYDEDDKPEALMYDRMMAGAVQVMKAQQAQIKALTDRVVALEGK